MAVRRIFLTNSRTDGRPIADFEGLPGEEGETELHYPYGLASGREGGGLLVEIQDDPDNHVALPPAGDRVAEDATVLYWGDTEIELTDISVEIRVAGSFFRLEAGEVNTDMTIRTTGDVIADGVSLKTHRHTGVNTGGGVSGPPQ